VKLVAIIASLIFPPLGVALRRGLGAQLLINVILTLAAYVPGVVHALYHCIVENRVVSPDDIHADQEPHP
jgi:uncharacterized membrane protein YqaE (UPF0057 family)